MMRRWGGIKSCFSVECEGNGDMAVLDLRHCNLSSVPTDIFKAEPNLEQIYLDANQIRELPRALFGLHSLHILGLSDNELTVLPSAVSNLTNLREVDISKNGIIDLPESVKNCKCLEQFDASVNPIGKIPDGFTQLLNLTHVYLNDAFLDRLPSNFGRLSKLKVLELRENHLRSLPESMSYFTQLERLDIGNNEFIELPTVVGYLVNLKELWMDSNGVRELPPEIGLLRQLLFLDVSKNRLERLPPEIECLQSLTDLYLSNNLLLELVENIGSLGNLQTLKLDENHLVELPTSIGRLSNLEELVVNHNELESLPSSIGFLRKLRILYADENFLEAIPLELGSCISMTILSLRDNRIVRIPDDIGRMPNLQVMNLACNRLECLPYTFRKLTSLKALWLSENQSKPMVPLQSDFDHGTQSHVLTCFMFPQQPPADEVPSEQYSEDSAGSIPASLLEEQIRQRSSIVFNIDEDDYMSRLARYQSPYPKDVKDRAAQYLASRRQQQQQEIEVTQPVLPSQHQCHQQDRHQYRYQYQHRKPHSGDDLVEVCMKCNKLFYLSELAEHLENCSNKHGEHAPEESPTTCTSNSNDERKDSPTGSELPLVPETPSSQQLLVPVILQTDECLLMCHTDADVNASAQSSESTSITGPVVVNNAVDEQAGDEELERDWVTHEPDISNNIEILQDGTPRCASVDEAVQQTVQLCQQSNVINNPVEVLRLLQSQMVTGRQLDISDPSQTVEGETNQIFVDRFNLQKTRFDEIAALEDKRLTLEVQFYNERAVDLGGPRKEFFLLILREIKEKLFDDGIKENQEKDYHTVGVIFALSMLQNGKLPRFLPEELLQEIFMGVNPSPCMLAIRKGLSELGVYQSSDSNSTQHQQQASQQQPVAVVVQSVDRSQQPQLLRPQEVRTVEVPWYEDQVLVQEKTVHYQQNVLTSKGPQHHTNIQIQTQTSEQRQGQPVVAVDPQNSNQRVISNGIAQRGNTGSGPGTQNVEPQPARGSQAVVRSIPRERLIGGQAAIQEEPVNRTPPVYQPPPPYTPRENRVSPPLPPEGDRRPSLETQHSFREEVPSSLSSFQGRPGVRLWSSSTGTPDAGQLGEMHSFNEEEPSFLQGPLRPPSYYEATNQSDRVPLRGVVHHVINASQGVNNTVITNGTNINQRSPPPQYSVQPEVIAELPVRQVLPEPEVPPSADRQPVAQVRPGMNASQRLDISQEDAQRFENRVRQLQRERAMERREFSVDGTRANVGDNRIPHEVAPTIPRVLNRSNSSESRNSEQSLHSSQEDDDPVDNDPTVELLQVEVYKNPNLGFSIAGGIDSGTNPFHPNDNKSIYVTKVQPDGPASYGLIPGDRILEVNGINLRRVTHDKAVLFLKHNQVVNLLIARKKEQPS